MWSELILDEIDRVGTDETSGPRGTIKMLVDGSGQIKMTKVGVDTTQPNRSSIWIQADSNRMERFYYQRCRSKTLPQP